MKARWILVASLACTTPNGVIDILLGGESDTLTRAPAVVALEIDTLDRSSTRSPLATASLPAQTIDLGTAPGSLVASLQAIGYDETDASVVFGATPFLELDYLGGATIPLMVQRRGEFARMPGSLTDARAEPVLTVNARTVYYVGGSSSGAQDPLALGGYDMLGLDSYSSTCGAKYSARTAAFVPLSSSDADGDSALVLTIGDDGAATIGLSSCVNNDVGVATNTTIDWKTIAGAKAVTGADSRIYIVGATKPDAVSNVILVVDPSTWDPDAGTESVGITYLASGGRQGAAAGWAPNRGLAIYGAGAGLEILPSGSTTSYPIPFPADSAEGLAMIAFDDHSLLVAGDANAPRVLDLTCNTSSCSPQPWGVAPSTALSAATLFAVGTGRFLLFGDDAQGASHAFLLTQTDTTEVPFKIARQGARAVQLETGIVVVVGGGTTTLESYVP